jgi:hypothetical protein
MNNVKDPDAGFQTLAAGDAQLCEGITKTRFSKPKMIQKNTSPYSKISLHGSDLAAGVCPAMLWSCKVSVQSTLHLHVLLL